jgi:hypothetical protein
MLMTIERKMFVLSALANPTNGNHLMIGSNRGIHGAQGRPGFT